MQAQATGNCTVTVQVRGHEIIGFETGGDDWRFGHIVSHAVFEAVEKTADALKAKPTPKRAKTETTTVKTEPARVPKSEPEQAVKMEPKERPAGKTVKARDRPIKAEVDIVDIASDDEIQREEYVEQNFP